MKLKSNPFYKMNERQLSEMAALEKETRPIVSFGVVEKHNHSVPTHDTFQKKTKISKKKVL